MYLDLKTKNYGGFVNRADKLLKDKVIVPAGYNYRWAGEYECELRAKERLKIILPVVFFMIFLLLYLVFNSAAEAAVLIFPTLHAMSGGLLLQWALGYNFSVAVWVGYIALFGIAVETGVVMVVYPHEALQHRLANPTPLTEADIEQAATDGAVQRLRPKLMTVTAVILSLADPAALRLTSAYGSGIVLPDSRLPQLKVGTPARFAVPVMSELESQNRSGALPPTRVRELLGCTSIVERLATTSPP